MAVPYTFGSATTSIPLSQLDSNFATAITLGNTAVQLGNTITTLTGVTNLSSSGALTLGSNGNTTAIYVDTSQNVGIGTSSPSVTLELSKGNNTAFRVIDDAVNARGGYIKATGTTVEVGTTSGVRPLLFTIDSVEKARIDTSGNLLVGTATALATLTVNGNITPSQAPSSNWGLDFAPSSSAGSYVTIANNGTYDLAAGSGFIYLYDNGGSGAAQIACVYGITQILWQYNSLYTVTSGTASKVNVFYNAGTSKYRIENKSGGSLSLYISTIKMRASV